MTKPFRPYDKQGQLLLNTFRQIEEECLRILPRWPWLRLLLRGVLVALEDAFIERQVSSTVDAAIDAYRASEEPVVDLVDQMVITETDSNVPGLPEMRITSSIAYDR